MSYTKLNIRYTTDGINTESLGVKTREGEKHRTIALPKKVQEYGDAHGYSSLRLDYYRNHLLIKGGGETLMNLDINGTNNNEYIRRIVSYEWLP